jgi:hypothetical protein
MVEYTWYPWVRVYVCDACAAPALDCRSHPVPVDGTTKWRFMTTPRPLWKHHYKYHRAPVVAPAPGTDGVQAGYLANDDSELPLHPLVLHPRVGPPPLQQWLLAGFEDSPATHNFLADCTTLDRHRAVKAIMAKMLYGTVAILPSAVAQITRADMLQYLTMAQLVFTVGSTGRALLGRLLGSLYFRVRDPSLPRIQTSLPPATSTATTRAFCGASAMAWGDCPGQHYCGALGKCVPLRVDLLHAVCDQPAKRVLCGLKAGNGKYHACFGYSINYATLQKPFPACAECRAILFDNDDAPPPCPHCHA